MASQSEEKNCPEACSRRNDQASLQRLAQADRLGAFGAHFGAQKMIFSRFGIKKAARMDRSNASAGLAFLKNGAKETRTPDPLHAMQVLVGSSRLLQLA